MHERRAALAAAAVLLTVVYVTSARNDTAAGKESVTVYVPSRDFAVGTPGWVKADDIVSAKPLPGQKSN